MIIIFFYFACLILHRYDEGVSFMTFVWEALNPWGVMLQRTKVLID
jgi:hypothetical protein